MFEEPASRPIWCGLVRRLVDQNSQEAQCPEAKAAVEKDLKGLREKAVWNEGKVREFEDVQRDSSIKDALFGRIVGILGVTHAEMAAKDQKWKASGANPA